MLGVADGRVAAMLAGHADKVVQVHTTSYWRYQRCIYSGQRDIMLKLIHLRAGASSSLAPVHSFMRSGQNSSPLVILSDVYDVHIGVGSHLLSRAEYLLPILRCKMLASRCN